MFEIRPPQPDNLRQQHSNDSPIDQYSFKSFPQNSINNYTIPEPINA